MFTIRDIFTGISSKEEMGAKKESLQFLNISLKGPKIFLSNCIQKWKSKLWILVQQNL
jgi:hypothetical protein